MGALWLVPLVPLLAAIVIATLSGRVSSPLRAGVLAIGAALVSSAIAAAVAVRAAAGLAPRATLTTISVAGHPLTLGLQADSLSATLAIVVAVISATVLAYSVWYMRDEPSPARFFAVMSLFGAAMLTLVLADNYILLYLAWEIVGVCSYLLIGHHWRERTASSAALKALLVTRIGDMGLLLGIACLFAAAGTVSYEPLLTSVSNGMIHGPLVTAGAWLIIAGALGKSAQAPLHVWLPDAMAGPTPVSALIHSATMVAGGMYLVARSYPLFVAAPSALSAWFIVTALTACGAALAAAAQRDVKRVLAYSTLSQLGEMGTAIGAGAPAAGMVHLVAHATFKALLFLSAGIATKASGTNTLTELHDVPPIASAGFLIGALSLSGIPPFAGFWSKTAMIAGTSQFAGVVFLALAPVSAFYIARPFLIAFRRPTHHDDGEALTRVMPVLILAAATAIVGFAPAPSIQAWPAAVTPSSAVDVRTWLDVAGALIGWAVAFGLYEWRAPLLIAAANRVTFVRTWARSGFGVDAFANRVAALTWAFSTVTSRLDVAAFDGMMAAAARAGSRRLSGTPAFDRAIGVAVLAGSRRLSRFDMDVFDRAARRTASFTLNMAGLSGRADDQFLDQSIEGGAVRIGGVGARVGALQTGRVYHYLFAVFAWIAVVTLSVVAVRVWR